MDEIAREAASKGVVYVQGARGVLEAIAGHVERRARAIGRTVALIDGLGADDAWRELGSRAGASCATDPEEVAAAVLCVSDVVVLLEGSPTRWGDALASALGHVMESDPTSRSLFVVLTERAPSRGRVIEIEPRASAEELRLYWEAVAHDADRPIAPGLDRLDALEGWWAAARATPADQRLPPPPLREPARKLLGRLLLSQRTWLVPEVLRLGSPEACEELAEKGVLVAEPGGRVVVKGHIAPLPWALDDARAVAEALDGKADPWAAARAGELWILAGEPDRAEAAAVRALGTLVDASARADFWSRWDAALLTLSPDDAAPRWLRSAELAVRVGDLDRAVELSARVPSPRGDAFDAMLTRGRVSLARGDVSTAVVTLTRAMEVAPDAPSCARAAVEMAEVRLLAGELGDSRIHAEAALAGAGDTTTRLQARNVLGKLLLADGSYGEAERHFAADACDASLCRDLTAELRARLNRAIALLSSGRLHEARGMLATVLDEGERHGEVRAVAFALSNLATIASLQCDYAEALRLTERALDVRRRIGDKLALALVITNLAYLRLRVGQIAEAEQALRFGKQACGPGIPGTRVAHFAVVAARIHLARGRTQEAAAELQTAILGARLSQDGSKLSECYRLEARVALEDGDLVRAGEALARARDEVSSRLGHAEVALLEAMEARAAGEPFEALARKAFELSRVADDTEMATDAHVLLHHAALTTGSTRAARLHLEGAVGLRNRTADALPEEMRKTFLQRREVRQIALLEAQLGARPASEPPPRACERCGTADCDGGCPRATLRSSALASPRPAPAGSRRLVGRDPAIVALLNAVQKIGPSDATVLIRGESGTGKELVAEAVHEASPRRSGPLVKVNCAALVETLLLSELFGHEKGSFTGASARKRGRFEMAEGGTIFLDEIGDISPATQVALLRVLQEKTFERVGGVTPIQANVRVVCATHRDLRALVARGEFREDLYYRLRGVVLEVPALRNRLGDLSAICTAILARIAAERGTAPQRLSSEALSALARHAWPGNVRELENALRAAALFAEGEVIEVGDFTDNVEGLRGLGGSVTKLPTSLALDEEDGTMDAYNGGVMPGASGNERANDGAPAAAGSSPTDIAYAHVRGGVSLSDMKRQIERDCIARALAESGGNITRAATLLGMKRPRLSQLVKQYGFGADALGADADSEET